MATNNKNHLDETKPKAKRVSAYDKELPFWARVGLQSARMLGMADNYKDPNFDEHYRRNIYNKVDPTADYPHNFDDLIFYKAVADDAKKSNINFKKFRETNDSVADAAWAKRLGLPYNIAYLPSNSDGTVRLPDDIAAQIPTDTTFLKNRIAANEQLINNYKRMYGRVPSDKNVAIKEGLKADKMALDSLRHTFKTGKPVILNEQAYIDRNWIKDGITNLTPSPLNVLKNYTVQYDKDNNRLNYRDVYNFNAFEDFVPGNEFIIEGTVPIRKQHKKQYGGFITRPSLKTGGSIYIKPSHRGRLTELKARTGKSEAELYSDGNPAHKKMVVFARNARKWHH